MDFVLKNVLICLRRKLRNVNINKEAIVALENTFEECYKKYYDSKYYKITGESFEKFAADKIKALSNCREIKIINEPEKDENENLQNVGKYYKGQGRIICMNIPSTILHETCHAGYEYLTPYESYAKGVLQKVLEEGVAVFNELIIGRPIIKDYSIGTSNKVIVFRENSIYGFHYFVYLTLTSLLGEKFLNAWREDKTEKIDYTVEIEKILLEEFGEEKAEKFLKLLYMSVYLFEKSIQPKQVKKEEELYIRILKSLDIFTLDEIELDIKELQAEDPNDENLKKLYILKRIRNSLKRREENPEVFKRNISQSKELIDESENLKLEDTIINLLSVLVEMYSEKCKKTNSIEELSDTNNAFLQLVKSFPNIYFTGADVTIYVLPFGEYFVDLKKKSEELERENKYSRLNQQYEI